VRDVDELLTVFPEAQRGDAGAVLKALVDARLLTSYEAHGTEPRERAGRRVEVVHESLLTAWPRLVRWRTEDEGGAQIRDQLRQAAHLWEEKGKPEDLLWTGTSFQEFQVWRARYPGGLSETEESFGRAMVARAERHRRMRRLGVASVILVLAGVLTVIGTSLLRTRAALTRTDASRLVALGRAVGVENDPTSTLAYAIASLERADSSEARTLALEAMAHGPIAIILSGDTDANAVFSGDGRWLATGPIDPSTPGPDAQVWARDGTRTRFPFARPEAMPYRFATGADALLLFDRQGDGGRDLVFTAFSLPDGRRLAGTTFRPPAAWRVLHDPARFAVLQLRGGRADLRVFPVAPPGDPVASSYDLRDFVEDWPTYADLNDEKRTRRRAELTFDPRGRWLAVPVGRDVILQPLRQHEPARRLAHHDAEVMALASSPDGKVLAARDTGGSIRLWSVASGAQVAALDADASSSHLEFSEDGRTVLARGGRRETGNGVTAGSLLVWRQPFTSAAPDREIRHPEGFFRIATDRSARWVAVGTTSRHAELWDLAAPADALPLALRRGVDRATPFVSLHPDGTWIAVCDISEMTLRPLGRQLPRVLSGHKAGVNAMAFAPDGQYVVSLGKDFEMRLWPLTGNPPAASRLLLSQRDGLSFLQDLATVPEGSFWAVSSSSGQLALVRPDGGARTIRAFSDETWGVAISPDGRRVAAGGAVAEEARVKVLDVASGREIAVLDAGDRVPITSLALFPDGTLATGSSAGVRVWDVDGGTYRSLWAPSASDRQAAV
jgi:WD40 repeat protein